MPQIGSRVRRLIRKFCPTQRTSPETFDLLGFTHICRATRCGKFLLVRRAMRKGMRAKLREVKTELMRRRHLPLPVQGKWLARVFQGHASCYGVPTNSFAV